MLVRSFWRDCDFRNQAWGAKPVDAFWVEATDVEAETVIFPLLQTAVATESRRLAEEFREIAVQADASPFCFLVARDLSSIDPFHVHYPFHQLWGAYSPFEAMPEITITDLRELHSIALPERASQKQE